MTRETIVENAARLFKSYGIKSVTMDDIANKMGVSKKTLYLHFDTKEDVLLACIDFATSQFEQKILSIKKSIKNPLFALIEICRLALTELSSYKGSFFYDMEKMHCAKEKNDMYKSHMRTEHIKKLFIQAQKENLLRRDVDIEIVCKIFFFLNDEFIADNTYIYPKNDLETIYKHILLFGIKGFLTNEHSALLDAYTEQLCQVKPATL